MADINNLKEMIVLAIHTRKIYFVVEVGNNISAERVLLVETLTMPHQNMTFSEYFNKK